MILKDLRLKIHILLNGGNTVDGLIRSRQAGIRLVQTQVTIMKHCDVVSTKHIMRPVGLKASREMFVGCAVAER